MALALRRHRGTLAGAGPPVCFDRVPRAQTDRKSRPSARLADPRPIALVGQRQDEYAMREPVRLSGRWPEPGGGRLRLPLTVFYSLKHPTFFMDHPMMRPAQ